MLTFIPPSLPNVIPIDYRMQGFGCAVRWSVGGCSFLLFAVVRCIGRYVFIFFCALFVCGCLPVCVSSLRAEDSQFGEGQLRQRSLLMAKRYSIRAQRQGHGYMLDWEEMVTDDNAGELW